MSPSTPGFRWLLFWTFSATIAAVRMLSRLLFILGWSVFGMALAAMPANASESRV